MILRHASDRPRICLVNTPGNINSYVHTEITWTTIEIVAWCDAGAGPGCVASSLFESFSDYCQPHVASVPSQSGTPAGYFMKYNPCHKRKHSGTYCFTNCFILTIKILYDLKSTV